MGKHLKLISIEYLQEYSNKVKVDWFDVFNKLKAKTQFSLEDFEYYIISSSLYSSKIEGNTLDANSFFRNRGKKTSPKKKEVQEIETLMEAYKFASENKLNRTNFLKTHFILSKTLLSNNIITRTKTNWQDLKLPILQPSTLCSIRFCRLWILFMPKLPAN